MTDEQRLDGLERIVKLMIKAGLRARKQSREQNEKINILIDMHLKSEERARKNEEAISALSAKTDERFASLVARTEEQSAKTDERLAALAARTEELAAKTEEKFAARVEAEARMDERLKSFMETVERIITERRNGKP